MRRKLTADEIRTIDEDTYLVVELYEDGYWMQGEGRVSYVKEYDSGKVTVGITGLRGHSCRLHVPADARSGLTFDEYHEYQKELNQRFLQSVSSD